MPFNDHVSRRKFLRSAGLLLGATAVPWAASRPANAASSVRLPGAANGPQLEQGIQIGDVRANRAVVWSRSDRPARMFVESISARDSPILSEFVGPSPLTPATIPPVWT